MVCKKHLILISVALLFFSCREEKQSARSNNTVYTSDSTQIWIKNGEDKDLPPEIRKEFLQKAYEKANTYSNDSVRLHYLSQLSYAYVSIKDSVNFRNVNKRARILSVKRKDSAALADLYWDMGDFYRNSFMKDSAYYEFGQASKIYYSLNNNFNEGRMLLNMAHIQKDIKDYTGAEINLIKAIELFLPLEKNRQLFLSYNLLGTIAKSLKEYEQSRTYFAKASEFLNNMPQEELGKYPYTLNNNIGNSYKEQGDYSKAIPYFNKIVNTDSLQYIYPNTYAIALDNLGYSQLKIGQLKISEANLNEAMEINIQKNAVDQVAMSHFHMADFYLAKRDTALALSNAEEALVLARQSNDNDLTLETLKLYPLLDPENAPAYLKEYLVLNDSLQEEERKIRNKFARIRFETDEFIAENQLLERQRQLWIGIAIGLFLLAVAVLVILSQRAKNRNLRFQQQQQEANQEIFNLMLAQSQKVEEGKQFEQKRISEELHDGILGQMNGIRMVLLGLNKKTDPDAITMRGDAIEKLQGVQEEIRTISHELNDASYQKFHNFIISIEDLLTTICEPANLEFHFNYDESLDWDAISGDIKINLYRIIQESLQNCIKYASANLVEIKMDSTSDIIEVTIKDDGRGFDNKKVKKGIGHKNISSRVGKLNGDWSLVSKPGEGTMVTVKVPYVLKESEMIPQVNGKEKLEQLEKTSS